MVAKKEEKKEEKKMLSRSAKDSRKVAKKAAKREADALMSKHSSALGNRLGMARQSREISQSLKMARFLACIAEPTKENACRAPDLETLRDTALLAFTESGVMVSDSAGICRFILSSDPRRPIGMINGSVNMTPNGVAVNGVTTYRFVNYDALQPLANFLRIIGLRITLWPLTNALTTQGYWVDAPIPNRGSAPNWANVDNNPTTSRLSQWPNSMQGNVNPLSKISCFLIQQGQAFITGGDDPNDVIQTSQPFAWRPWQAAQVGPANAPDGSFHGMSIEGLASSVGVFSFRLECVYELQPNSLILSQFINSSGSRPEDEALDGIDDVLNHIRPAYSGNAPITPVEGPSGSATSGSSATIGPRDVVKTLTRAAMDDPASVSDTTGGMLETLAPLAETLGSHAWDLAKEYGPDLLETGLDLIPGGGVATNLAKWGLKAWNAFSS